MGHQGSDGLKGGCKMGAAPVIQIVPGHRGYHNVFQIQIKGCFGHPQGFTGINRGGGIVGDIAEPAVSRAFRS